MDLISRNAADAAKKRSREEWEAFVVQLPELLNGPLVGRFVLFYEGKVQGDYDTLHRGIAAGVERFGRFAGFVVPRVEEREPLNLGPLFSAGLAFGEAALRDALERATKAEQERDAALDLLRDKLCTKCRGALNP